MGTLRAPRDARGRTETAPTSLQAPSSAIPRNEVTPAASIERTRGRILAAKASAVSKHLEAHHVVGKAQIPEGRDQKETVKHVVPVPVKMLCHQADQIARQRLVDRYLGFGRALR